jgi:hypothetical protein
VAGFIMEWTSRECNRYLVEGGDIAVLPVGSAEVLGPHLPLGGRCFVAEAFAQLLAAEVEGVRIPLTPFSSVAHTFDRPGSVAVPEAVVNRYLRAAMDDLLAGGFRRILLLTFNDYLAYYTSQEFYEDHGVAAAGIHLGELLWSREVGEDSLIAGALRVLGKTELVDKVVAENKLLLDIGAQHAVPLPGELQRLLGYGVIGYTYPAGAYPISPNPNLSAEAGEGALRKAAAGLAPSAGALRDYNEFLAKRHTARGLLWRGWRWTE